MTSTSMYYQKFLLYVELRAQSSFSISKSSYWRPPKLSILLGNVFMSKELMRNNYSKNSDIGKLKNLVLE